MAGIFLLLVVASAGALFLALVSYLYGKYIEDRHGGRRGMRAIESSNDVWMLGLLSCDFGPSPHTNGPARTLPFPDESEKLALRVGSKD